MPVAENPAPTGIWHRPNDAHRSLARIAARLFYVKDKEELGLEEVDRVPIAVERAVRRRFLITATLFLLCILLAFLVLAVWGAAALDGQDIDQPAAIAVSLFFVMAASVIAYWRHFQMGLGIVDRIPAPSQAA